MSNQGQVLSIVGTIREPTLSVAAPSVPDLTVVVWHAFTHRVYDALINGCIAWWVACQVPGF